MAHVEAITHAQDLLFRFNNFQVIQQLLADELAWQNLEDHNGRIFAALSAILATEQNRTYPLKLYDTVYSVMVCFTKCWPRNNYDHPEGQPRVYQCAIMLTPITRPLYTSTGLMVDAGDLAAIIKYGKDPFTREPLNYRDINYLKAQAQDLKIHIPKTRYEKFEWMDVFQCFALATPIILALILAIAIPPLLVGYLPFTLLATPLLTTPFSYLATNFWFKKSIQKKVAGFSDNIKGLIARSDEVEEATIMRHQPDLTSDVQEYHVDQPGLPLVIGEPDHPAIAPASPPQNPVAFNANSRRAGMLSWLNRIEPALHNEEAAPASPGLRRGNHMLD